MKFFLGVVFVLFATVGFETSSIAEDNVGDVSNNVIELDEASFRCWGRCDDCLRRANNDNDKNNCYDMNANCCESSDKKPVYKSCGCI